MKRARNHCAYCDNPGHNAQTCLQRPAESKSKSQRAAIWLSAQSEGVFETAAVRFGITRQAVAQAWERLFGDRPPPGFADRVGSAIDQVRAGVPVAEAARAAGCTRSGVYKRMRSKLRRSRR